MLARLRLMMALFLGLQTLHGATIALHLRDLDPLDEGFITTNASGAGVSDGVYSAWHITPNLLDLSQYCFDLTPEQKTTAVSWSATGRFRLLSTADSAPNAVFMNMDFGDRRYDMNVFALEDKLYLRANTAIWIDQEGGHAAGLVYEIPGSATAYHLYRMAFSSGLVTIYVDGVPVVTEYTGHTDFTTGNCFWWGTEVGQGANFNLARLDMTLLGDAPEPSTIAFVGFGLIGVIAARRRLAR